jgi:hypothetical protein
MSIGRIRVWLPDGGTRTVPFLEEPRLGMTLKALGIREGWKVSDLRESHDPDLDYDVWVEASARAS